LLHPAYHLHLSPTFALFVYGNPWETAKDLAWQGMSHTRTFACECCSLDSTPRATMIA
jgi:hypothetical protein